MEVNTRNLIVLLTYQNSGQNRNPIISNNFNNKFNIHVVHNDSNKYKLYS